MFMKKTIKNALMVASCLACFHLDKTYTSDQKNPLMEAVAADKSTQVNSTKKLKTQAYRAVQSVIPMGGHDSIVLNFNNASLKNVVNQIADIFGITFLPDDMMQGPGLDTRSLDDTKINFKTNKPMTRREVWSWFQSRLKYANWATTPTSDEKTFIITNLVKAKNQPLPTYINCSIDFLPNSDVLIRYVYELTNSSAEQMQALLNRLISQQGKIDIYSELKTLIITDSAYNIKALMQIVIELDRVAIGQVISILKLQQADAKEVADIINSLQTADNPNAAKSGGNGKKVATVYAVPEDVKVIPEPRTNALILLGAKNSVARIEKFVKESIDTKLAVKYEPVHVYALNYAPAGDVAQILNNVLAFGNDTEVGKAGGVRGGEKYFSNVSVTPEPQGNRLIIRSSQQDYEHLKKVIDQLDRKQDQVAVEVLIVSLAVSDVRTLGVQWRNKYQSNLNVQYAGLTSVITNTDNTSPTYGSIVSNLISIAQGLGTGNTVVTLGKTSVWAVFDALQSLNETKIISNPFLIATNKYNAAIAVGSTRRVIASQTGGSTPGNQYSDMDAALVVNITPQINQIGIINLSIGVQLSDFSSSPSSSDITAGNQNVRKLNSNANLADGEVLALGGLIRRNRNNQKNKVPLLGDIPLIGRLFSYQSSSDTDEMLMIFLSPKIIKYDSTIASEYTEAKSGYIKNVLNDIQSGTKIAKDPIQKWFFDPVEKGKSLVADFLPDKEPVMTEPENSHIFKQAI